MFKGKQTIFFMMNKLAGQKIKTIDKGSEVCRSGAPINLNLISTQCEFPKNLSYPYEFTVLVANMNKGREGEGTFTLGVYAQDKSLSLSELS